MMNDLPHKTGVERAMDAQSVAKALPELREAMMKWILPPGWSVTIIAHEHDSPPDDINMQLVTSDPSVARLLIVFDDLLGTIRTSHAVMRAREGAAFGEDKAEGAQTPYGGAKERRGFGVFSGGRDVASSVDDLYLDPNGPTWTNPDDPNDAG